MLVALLAEYMMLACLNLLDNNIDIPYCVGISAKFLEIFVFYNKKESN